MDISTNQPMNQSEVLEYYSMKAAYNQMLADVMWLYDQNEMTERRIYLSEQLRGVDGKMNIYRDRLKVTKNTA